MHLRTAPTILVVAVVFALLVPTGAIVGTMGSPTDDLFGGEPGVEMTPHDGPNGEYVEAAEDDELRVDLSDPGVNSEAFTGVERVFDVVNTDTTNVTVWVTHDGDGVTLYDDATGASIEGKTSAIELAPGEAITVSIDVDSRGTGAGEELLSTVTLHAEYDAAVPAFGVEIDEIPESVTEGDQVTVRTTVTNVGEANGTRTVSLEVDGTVVDQREITLGPGESRPVEFTFETGSDDADVVVRVGDSSVSRSVSVTPGAGSPSSGGGIGGGGGGAEPSQPGEPAEEEPQAGEELSEGADMDGDTEVVFDEDDGTEEDSEPAVQVREMDASELDSEDSDRPPQAVITPDTEETGGDGDAPDAGGPSAEAFDTMTLVDEPAELSGERSTIGAAESVSSRDRITQIVDIEVPPERADQPATVRMRVDRDRLGDVDGERTMIGHRTEDGGWELLETSVVDRNEEAIVVQARTPGFSPFAVFSPPNVTYEWELPDGTVLEGQKIDPSFEEPGIYDVRLTVTDARGRQSTTTHRVLANDVPEATIEVVDRQGENVTLAANVDDELGETEVTWTFPDGTEMTGEEVTYPLETGEHEIGIRVVDEYGAESESRHIVAVGPSDASPEAVADALGMDLGLLVQLGLLSSIGLAVAVGYRRFPWTALAPSRRRGPEITVLGAPVVDAGADRITLEEFAVENATELGTVRIEIIDEGGRTLLEKRLDLSGMRSYTAPRETVTVPPGIDIDPDGGYTVRVKATDAQGRSAERDLSGTAAVERDLESDPDRGPESVR